MKTLRNLLLPLAVLVAAGLSSSCIFAEYGHGHHDGRAVVAVPYGHVHGPSCGCPSYHRPVYRRVRCD